ncbi:MAG TPA: MoxR family ATPase [Clostridiaceae bacterium]|jgi:MoxR-like ATPase|nr:MoxR family ATPase [Clostridiaceae bacterium]
MPTDTVTDAKGIIRRVHEGISSVFIGKDSVINHVLISLIAGGHILLEDVPGLGKTTLVKALSRVINCDFSRIQFTPDVLPSDVTGYTAVNIRTGEREVVPGAIMSQIILADEINRTGPKTQSSLLEAMEEGQVTIDGQTFALPQPFFVLATQNPAGQIGTYPLPESQLDRFMMKISIGYPSKADEAHILSDRRGASPLDLLKPVASAEDILSLRTLHRDVKCSPAVIEYIVALGDASRRHEKVELGISPRGTLSLMHAAMAAAMLNGRDYVTPDDVKSLVPQVFSHRIILSERHYQGKDNVDHVLREILRNVPIPV